MRIKKWMVGLLACTLIGMNMPAVCFAAGPDTQVPEGISVEINTDTADKGTAGTVSDDVAGTEAGKENNKTDKDDTADKSKEAADTGDTEDGSTVVESDGMIALPFDSIEDLKEALGIDGENDDETVTTGRVNVSPESYLHLRTGSGMDKDIIGHLFNGDEVEIIGEDGDWYQVVVKERDGYVYKDYVDVIEQTGSEDGKTDEDMMTLLLYLLANQNANGNNSSSLALTPDGNLTLVDDIKEEHEDGSGKQFITVTTKDGNYFYLVIDRDEDGDENVYFMNLVDEADLLALMDEDEAAKYTQPAPTEPVEPDETEPVEPDEEEPEEEPEKKSNALPALILLLVLLGGGGAFVFVKMKGKQKEKEQVKPDPDADYVEGEDDSEFILPDDVGGNEESDGLEVLDESAFEEEDESTMFDADDNEPV